MRALLTAVETGTSMSGGASKSSSSSSAGMMVAGGAWRTSARESCCAEPIEVECGIKAAGVDAVKFGMIAGARNVVFFNTKCSWWS